MSQKKPTSQKPGINKTILLLIILLAAIFSLIIYLMISIQQKVSFQETFLKVSQYPNRQCFDNTLGEPVYALKVAKDYDLMKKMGPIKERQKLKDKTMCLYGYTGIPMRFIVVYYEDENNNTYFVTWITP